MTDEVDALVDWAYSIERRLWSRLESLREDLWSEDNSVRSAAEAKATELLSWLLPPLTPQQLAESREESIRRIQKTLEGEGYPASKTRKLAEKLAESNRDRGRPRERGIQAIRALELHLRTSMTWRDITLEVSGPCRDRKCYSYCPACEDVRRSIEPGRPEKPHAGRRHCSTCKFPVRVPAQKQQICFRCVDQVRKLADEAKEFLQQEGIGLMPRLASLTPGEN